MPKMHTLCLTILLSLFTLAVSSSADDDGVWTYEPCGNEASVTGCVDAFPSAINPIKSGYNTDFILLPTLKPTLKPTFNSPLRYKNFSQGAGAFRYP